MSSLSDEDRQPRKRNRVSLACLVCKRRRVKCNRGFPCSACIRHKEPEGCIYQEAAMKVVEAQLQHNSNEVPPRMPLMGPTASKTPFSSFNTSRPQTKLQPLQLQPQSLQPAVEHRSGSELSEMDILKERIKNLEAALSSKSTTPDAHLNMSNFQYGSGNYMIPLVDNFEPRLLPRGSFSPESSISSNYRTSLVPTTSSGAPSRSDVFPFDVYGRNPVASKDDVINLFSGVMPGQVVKGLRSMNSGPLCWITIMRNDPAINLMWKKCLEIKNRSKSGALDDDVVISRGGCSDTTQFSAKRAVNEDLAQLRAFRDDPGNEEEKYKNESVREAELNNVNCGVEGELEFIKRIEAVLPKQKVIWLLIDRFFEYVYPFMPFLDELDFRESMSKIIGEEAYNDLYLESIKVEKRLDFATVGIFLVMLRFGYLSLLSNDTELNHTMKTSTDPKFQELTYLLQNPVSMEIVDVAQMCLNHFKLMRQSSLVILQCALYVRVYQSLAPEEGDGPDGAESQVYIGLLIQMANAIGLNRDPDHFTEYQSNAKIAGLWRKIWCQLVLWDTLQATQTGSPLVIREKYYDTKLPFLSSAKDDTETALIENLLETNRFIELAKPILDKVLNIKGSVQLKELSAQITVLEEHMRSNYGTLDDILGSVSPDDDKPVIYRTVNKVVIYLQARAFMSSLFYYYYLYYEGKNNIDLSYFYLKKLLVISFADILPSISKLLFKSHEYFGPGFDFILSPMLQISFNKCIDVTTGAIGRVKVYLLTSGYKSERSVASPSAPADEQLFSKLNELTQCLAENVEGYIKQITKLSKCYYYAWRMSKVHSFLLNLIKQDAFYFVSEMQPEYLRSPEVLKLNNRNIFKFLNHKQISELVAIINYRATSFAYSPPMAMDSNMSSISPRNIDDPDRFWADLFSDRVQKVQTPAPMYGTPAPIMDTNPFAGVFGDFGFEDILKLGEFGIP